MFVPARSIALGLACLLAAAALARAGEPEHRMLLLFTMNDLEERGDGTTRPDVDETAGSPQVELFGANLVEAGQAGTRFVDWAEREYPAGRAAAWASGVNDEPVNGIALRFQPGDREPLAVRFDVRSTATGAPAIRRFQYRIDGEEQFRTVEENRTLPRDGDFHEVRFDLTELEELEGAEELELRWTFAPGEGNGTTRLDNLKVVAEAGS